ncbi:protein yellow [Drosophila grimshawi]|uniref:Protein yellow n=1 Tax=Drosophila grimshawi TaxID=7222 RepID=B4JAW9_DROGR|nr:protein yellow [Drosophila grimshawi]EDW02839.1 GH10914 [Drosophila grimshawi]
MRSIKLLALCLISCCCCLTIDAKLEERFSWKQLTFDWPSAEAEADAKRTGHYIEGNNLPLGLERWENKLFVTVPRWKAGVAATLNYIDLSTTEKSPKLRPYPSWEANKLPIDVKPQDHKTPAGGRLDADKAKDESVQLMDNATIISTFRIHVDSCDRLWVLDTGLADILGNPKQITPSSILVFDLKTDRLLLRYAIPADQSKEDTFYANIIVDVERDQCNDAFAYVPDLGAYGVVVYSLRDNKSYRVKHNYFHFDPLQGDFNVGGVNFQWTDGVFGMAVGPLQPDNTKDIYFHALASTKEFKVSNRVLQNQSHVNGGESYYDFKLVGDRGMNGQSTAEVYDKETGVLFYTQVNKDAIACWNVKRPYMADTQGLIDSDSHTLIFPNDLKMDTTGSLWVLSDRMPTYLYKELDHAAVNYRILTGKNRDLVRGTPCEL